jgi:hypothetical protein
MTVPSEFSVTPASITTTGTFVMTKATQSPNMVQAGPASGGAGVPGYRALVGADIQGALGTVAVGGDLSGTTGDATVTRARGAFAMPGVLTPTVLGGDVNDYNPTNLATNVTVRLSGNSTTARTITGLQAQALGDRKVLCNVGTGPLLFPDQSASSSAANRFYFGAQLRLPPGMCQTIWYDTTAPAGWRLQSGTPLDPDKTRVVSVLVGDPDTNSPALVAGNDTPDGFTNRYGRDVLVVQLACKVNSGSVVIRPIATGGGDTSILTGDCTCGSAWTNCAVQTGASAPLLHSFPAPGGAAACSASPCGMDFNIQSVDGTAKYLRIDAVTILQ